MRVYFDVSGNTGCIVANNEKLKFAEQPILAVGTDIC